MSKNKLLQITQIATKKRRTIGIGLTRVNAAIVKNLKKAKKYADIVVVGEKIPGFTCVASKSFDPIIDLALEGKIDAVLRGNFDAVEAYSVVRSKLHLSGNFFAAGFFRVNGIKHLDKNVNNIFSLVNTSFSNERTLTDKIQSLELILKFFQKMKIAPKVGIMGPGKAIDALENIPEINRGLAEAMFLLHWCNTKNIEAKFYNHQLEYAAQEANIILCADSWSGNMAVHCLVYFGTTDHLGTVELNVEDIIFINTGEAMQDFTNSILFGAFLANSNK